ncbi:MAG: pilus assembly protein [Deltaproteobacteria bacterium]|nr:pilus assembly protein [Deltaproteobacteria bacterium]MDZ4345718.1 TadE family protein [Candidatus Binatia bacterium]
MTETVSVKKLIRSKKGQSLIELTLMFPLMLLMVYGVVEVGQVISTYLTLTHTTREGANLTSRGTDPNTAIEAIKMAASPTIRDDNQSQWRIIYTEIVQKPATPCLTPPTGCIYEISDQIVRGSMPEVSKLGAVGATVTIPGVDNVIAGQIFKVIEVYYDYGPNVITFIGNNIDKTFYDRTIFTKVDGQA